MKARLGPHTLTFAPDEPVVMGILNLGTDSVADATVLRDPGERLAAGLALHAAGAGIVDVGVLSGRTDTAPVPEAEEIALLEPVVAGLAQRGVAVSIDTWRPAAAAAAVAAGAALINDVSGLRDPEMATLAASTGAGLVVMHTRADPKQAHFPDYDDPVADVIAVLSQRISLAGSLGVDFEQIVIDPGLDYAKTPAQSIEVLRRLDELQALARPVLLAVSRKYFVGVLTGRAPTDRLAGTLAAVEFGVAAGAQIVRVHDVAAVSDYLRLRAALHGSQPRWAGTLDDESLMWIAPKRAPGG
ncbi:MAG: dihydropteroate synthase [Solirubrobacteraceae bacterium]